MRLDLICVLLAAACLCFITPTAAVDMQLPALPQSQTVNLTEYDFFENNSFDVFGFMKGMLSPFLDIFGSYFYVIVYGLCILLVWMRSRSLTLVSMMLAVSVPVWSVWLPQEMFIPLLMVIILGIAACLYKLFKSKN